MTTQNPATYAPTPTATHITVRPTLNLRTSNLKMSPNGTRTDASSTLPTSSSPSTDGPSRTDSVPSRSVTRTRSGCPASMN